MIRITLNTPPCEGLPQLKPQAAKALKVSETSIKNITIIGRSLDARRGRPPCLLWAVEVSLDKDEKRIAAKTKAVYVESETVFAPPSKPLHEHALRPVIVGSGPAGMFAAIVLARAGCRPIVIERGGDVQKRIKATDRFFATHELDPECNIQFGEGGAGTFSDGKLGTLIRDPSKRIDYVLKVLAEHGADGDILYVNKPHVGTDVLRVVVASIRDEIIRLGGEYMFDTKLTNVEITDGRISGAEVTSGGQKSVIKTDTLFLGIGHSARDTFRMLHSLGVPMQQKPFSMGLRIEHLQSEIDKAMYHDYAGKPGMPSADYKLSCMTKSGRGVYTFCMCPGGTVVPASSDIDGFVTNGMSYRARDLINANSALLVGISPEDVGKKLFDGMELQRRLEKAAFAMGGGDQTAPAQTLGDFMQGRVTTGFGSVKPSCLTGAKGCDLNELLPRFMSDAFKEALPVFGTKIKGFDSPDVVLTGIESRSTCPLRILRGEDMQSTVRGLYPIGEGAGYAGGITSAAVDGIKAAEKYLS